MDIRNVSPLGALYVPALNLTVGAGEVVTVRDALGSDLCDQPDNWQAVPAATTAKGAK